MTTTVTWWYVPQNIKLHSLSRLMLICKLPLESGSPICTFSLHQNEWSYTYQENHHMKLRYRSCNASPQFFCLVRKLYSKSKQSNTKLYSKNKQKNTTLRSPCVPPWLVVVLSIWQKTTQSWRKNYCSICKTTATFKWWVEVAADRGAAHHCLAALGTWKDLIREENKRTRTTE